jgi:hypothetical protein
MAIGPSLSLLVDQVRLGESAVERYQRLMPREYAS